MNDFSKGWWRHLLPALMIYSIAIIYQGYQYGQGDQSQIIPVLYEQDHPGTYLKDHYVNAYLDSPINERTVFHFLLRHLGYQNQFIVFLWHALFSILLIAAWIAIAGLYIKNRVWQWLAVALLLTLGFHFSTGGNEIYYPQLVPSLYAKALASWAIYFWIKEKYFSWIILLAIAGYLQPLVGLQLFLVMSLALFIKAVHEKTWKRFPFIPLIIYTVVTLPWIILLAVHNGGHEDPDTFRQILEFRLSHHFFGSSFKLIQLAMLALFTMICVIVYEDKVKWLVVRIAMGCLLYELGVEVLQWPFMLYTQWWKATIWIEAFAFIGIFSFLDKKISLSKFKLNPTFILGGFLFAITLYRLTGVREAGPLYMLPFAHVSSDEIDISEQAGRLTNESSLFVIPPDLSSFRWYSKRSNYVDYKAMLHTERFLFEWYRRIEKIYGFDSESKAAGSNIDEQARYILESPTDEMLHYWKSLGITHFISPNNAIPQFSPIGKNESYGIYAIP